MGVSEGQRHRRSVRVAAADQASRYLAQGIGVGREGERHADDAKDGDVGTGTKAKGGTPGASQPVGGAET